MTQQGFGLAVLGALLLVAGRLLGTVELYIVGAAALGACVIALGLVWLRRLDLDVHRTVDPPRVTAGAAARVDLDIRNLSSRRTPVVRLRDEISGTKGADLLVAPFSPGAAVRAAYRLPTNRRGMVSVGPISFEMTDPLGLARSRVVAGTVSDLIVLPPVLTLPPVPRTIADDPLDSAEAQASWSRTQGDFYALREYVVGDDLRRVHWASTARHDELMVRQDELPWQGRLIVVLDNRRTSLSGEGLDLATSFAASVLHASRLRGDLVRLITTEGTDSGIATGNIGFNGLMEHLAVVEPSAHGRLSHAVQAVRSSQHGGALVVFSGLLSDEERAQLGRLADNRRSLIHVQLHPSAWDAAAVVPPDEGTTRGGFVVTGAAGFVDRWTSTVGLLSSARR